MSRPFSTIRNRERAAFGGIFILFFIGIAFMLYGIFRMILAFKWRKFNKEIKDSEEEIIEVEIIE